MGSILKRGFTLALLAIDLGCHDKSTPVEAIRTDAKPGEVIENSIGLKLLYIPPGQFEMGSPEAKQDANKDEKLHHVELTNGFYLGKFEVTQSEFERVAGHNPSWNSTSSTNSRMSDVQDTTLFPVDRVSWYEAVEFCNSLSRTEGLPEYYVLKDVVRKDDVIKSAKVSKKGGNGYRLPTEAEWEYACRAGTQTAYHFGDTLNGKDANVNGEEPYGTTSNGPNLAMTRLVGSYPPNKFGLYDMHGNVREWCSDWYLTRYSDDQVDPSGSESGELRVTRGGAYDGSAKYARSADRDGAGPSAHHSNKGFRVARTHP